MENEQPEPLEIDNDIREIVNNLNPEIVLNQDKTAISKITYDADSIKRVLDKINSRHEAVVLESDLLGLRVQIVSKDKPVEKLQTMAHNSLKFMMEKIPCRVPLGVF